MVKHSVRLEMAGNKKKQTFADCEWCGLRFGPLDRLSKIYCSYRCKVLAQKGKPSKLRGIKFPNRQRARIVICKVCNKMFRAVWEFKNKVAKYCSKKCYHNRYGGNKTPLIRKLRTTEEYKQWRTSVFTRDNFTCQSCGDNRGGNLEAHHINPVSTFILSIYDIDNGVTLCSKCHAETYTNKPRADIAVKRWESYIGKKAIKLNQAVNINK